MSNNAVALPEEFKKKITDKVLTMFMDLIPEAQLEAHISKEIQAFFEDTKTFTIERVTRMHGWGENKSIEQQTDVKTLISPFRYLVWSQLTEWLTPKLALLINEEKGRTNQELIKWLGDEAKPLHTASYQQLFNETCGFMSRHMFKSIMMTSARVAYDFQTSALQMSGITSHNIPSFDQSSIMSRINEVFNQGPYGVTAKPTVAGEIMKDGSQPFNTVAGDSPIQRKEDPNVT